MKVLPGPAKEKKKSRGETNALIKGGPFMWRLQKEKDGTASQNGRHEIAKKGRRGDWGIRDYMTPAIFFLGLQEG